MVKHHHFVGVVDRDFVLVQHSTKLYLMNLNRMSHWLFYQIMLK